MAHPHQTIDQTTIETFCGYLADYGHSPSTVDAYHRDLLALLRAHPGLRPATFSDAAAAWLTRHRDEWSAATVNRRLATFNKFAKWLGVPGLDGYRRMKPEPRPKKRITIDAVLDVLDKIPELGLSLEDERNAFAMVSLCGLSGLRIHAAVSVTRESFGEPDGETVPLHIRGKGGREHIVPFPVKYWKWLLAYGGPIHTLTCVRSARWVIEKTFASCGYAGVQSHQLRNAFATAAYQASHGDIEAVRKLLGHADISTTQRYVDTPYSTRAAIVASLGEQ